MRGGGPPVDVTDPHVIRRILQHRCEHRRGSRVRLKASRALPDPSIASNAFGDHLGSTKLIVDAKGTVLQHQSFETSITHDGYTGQEGWTRWG